MNRLILLVTAGILASVRLFAQSGDIVGKIVEQVNGIVVPFGLVQLTKDGITVASVTSGIDGQYKIGKIPCGTYTMKVNCVGYDSLMISNITVNENRKLTMNLEVTLKNNRITEIIAIPLYVPKKDTLKHSPGDSIKPKAPPKRDHHRL